EGGFSGASAGEVYALQATNGSLLWHYTVKGACCRGLVMTDTTVYISEFDRGGGHIDALRASDGSLLWQYQGDRQVNQATVMDGVVFLTYESAGFKDTGSTVDALRISDGSHLWRYSIDPQS